MPPPPSHVQQYFDRDQVWGETYWTELQIERARQSIAILPADADSVLDIGCGAGVVTQELNRNLRSVVGMDLAFSPLRQLRQIGVSVLQGDARAVPFADRSFQLVAATEVIEHLTEVDQRLALREFARVARKYVLLTVPYRETLETSWLKCEHCGHVFHAWGHTQTFTESRMENLLQPEFALHRVITLGDWTKHVPAPLVRLAHRFGGFAVGESGRCICPQCRQSKTFVSRRWARLLWSLPLRLFPLPRHAHWMAALYERA
ncbi:MAG: class I SAM-dependent methyltransferase [Terriglobales bacterium]